MRFKKTSIQQEYEQFYEDTNSEDVMNRTKDAWFVHIWNKMAIFREKNYKMALTSWAPYLQMARKYCPKVYDSLDEYFKK